MVTPAISLEVLPAGYGDCLLLQCPVGQRVWRMLVDTGPDETYRSLRSRLLEIPLDRKGRRYIDVFVVTHIDHDHIGGAALLLNDKALALSFGDIWFNAPPRPAKRGVAEGEGLSTLLGAAPSLLPWNRAFRGAAAVVPEGAAVAEVQRARGAPRITLLAPSSAGLTKLFKKWDVELARLRRKETDTPALPMAQARGRVELDIRSLARQTSAVDRSVPNGSSIAFLLEHRGVSVLLGADAYPTVLIPALKELAIKRNLALPLHLDVLKLSHHGSRANLSKGLFGAVQASKYVFSTNNARFNHPDDEAVASVIVHGGQQACLCFNHGTLRNHRWADETLQREFGYRTAYPTTESGGLRFEIAARGA